jgi:hypothetical protein
MSSALNIKLVKNNKSQDNHKQDYKDINLTIVMSRLITSFDIHTIDAHTNMQSTIGKVIIIIKKKKYIYIGTVTLHNDLQLPSHVYICM